jgi:O-acetyl-ADP-ribose deacetylase (regulator of RNase III)
MKTIQGDLIQLALNGDFDVIVHGCNCHCSMGAGIARAIKATFPEAYDADARTLAGDRTKLGTISYVTVSRNNCEITVVNGYTQYNFKGAGVLVDYDALRSVMAAVALLFSGKRIGYPKIGAGLAGGDWSVIAPIIDEELHAEDHTLVELPGA